MKFSPIDISNTSTLGGRQNLRALNEKEEEEKEKEEKKKEQNILDIINTTIECETYENIEYTLNWIGEMADVLPLRLIYDSDKDKESNYIKFSIENLSNLDHYCILTLNDFNEVYGFYQDVNSRSLNQPGITCLNTTDRTKTSRPIFFNFQNNNGHKTLSFLEKKNYCNVYYSYDSLSNRGYISNSFDKVILFIDIDLNRNIIHRHVRSNTCSIVEKCRLIIQSYYF